jgi:hypothetical protein
MKSLSNPETIDGNPSESARHRGRVERQLAWSLPLIVLNVVIHVIGLGLINESIVRVLSDAMDHRRFMPTFVLVMGVAALLATILHGIEAATWAAAYQVLGALPARTSTVATNRYGARTFIDCTFPRMFP